MPESTDKIHEDFVVGKVVSVSAAELNQALKTGTGMVARTEQVDVEIQEDR